MRKHTPGPWKGGRGSFYKPIYGTADDSIAWVDFENDADYTLTLAAPTMLAALKMVRDTNSTNPHFPGECMTAINAAIAEAEQEPR